MGYQLTEDYNKLCDGTNGQIVNIVFSDKVRILE